MFNRLKIKIKLRNLKGLEIVGFDNNRTKIKIDKNTPKDNIELFINSLPKQFQLSFFDNFHPQISDPGAYVWVQRYNNDFAFMLTNHGWSSEWKQINSKDLLDYIDKNKEFTSDYFEIYQKHKNAVIGDRY